MVANIIAVLVVILVVTGTLSFGFNLVDRHIKNEKDKKDKGL